VTKVNLDFYKSNNIYVDLAVEAHDIVRGQIGQEIPGVIVDKEKYSNATVTIVKIVEDYAEQIMGKPRGTILPLKPRPCATTAGKPIKKWLMCWPKSLRR
jgi:spore protease